MTHEILIRIIITIILYKYTDSLSDEGVMRMKKLGLISAVMVLAAGMLFAQGAREPGSYVFATDATWPPMEFVDERGDIVGFDVDLIQALAEVEGITIELRNTAWDGIFAGLANRAYDGVISSVTITEDRKASMDFTEPYTNAGQVLIVRTDMPNVAVLDDLTGRRVGVQNGTTGDFVLDDYPGITRMAYDEIGFAVEDLLNRNVDGVVADSPIAADFVMNNPNYQGRLRIAGEPFTEEYLGIAVRKGNTELLAKLNSGLQKLRDSGVIAELENKWLR